MLVPLASLSSSPVGGVAAGPVATESGPHQFDHHRDTLADFPGASARNEPGGSASTSGGADECGNLFTFTCVVDAAVPVNDVAGHPSSEHDAEPSLIRFTPPTSEPVAPCRNSCARRALARHGGANGGCADAFAGR